MSTGQGNSSLQAAASGRGHPQSGRGGGGRGRGSYNQSGRGSYKVSGRGGWQQQQQGPPPTTQTAAAMQQMASMGPGVARPGTGPLPPHTGGYMPAQGSPYGLPPQQYQMHPQGAMMMPPQGMPMYRGPMPPGAQRGPPYSSMPPQQYPLPQYGQQQIGVRHYPMNANAAPMNRSAPPSSLGAAAAAGGVVVGGPNVPSTRPAPSPRVKKVLAITDKDGNPISFEKKDDKSNSGKSSTPAANSSNSPVPTDDAAKKDEDKKDGDGGVDTATNKMSSLQLATAKKSEEAGNAMLKAAQEAIAAGSAKKAKEAADKKAKEEAEIKAKEEAEKAAKEEAERIAREKLEAEERERLAEAEARARKEAEERARKEFEDRQRLEAEEKEARIKAEEELKAKLAQAKEQSASGSEEKKESTPAVAPKANISPSPSSGNFRPGGFRPGGARPGGGLRPGAGAPVAAASDSSAENVNTANGGDSARKPLIYSKQMLLSLRDEDYCVCRPDDLIDMTVKAAGGGGGGMMGRRQSSGRGNYGGQGNHNRGGQDGRQGGGDWSRGREMPRPPQGQSPGRGGGRGGGGSDWNRGQAPPPNRGGRGGHQGNRRQSSRNNNEPFPDDDFAPLVVTENHWRPEKDTSVMVKIEKQVKSILNKMTKEKFDKLSSQMCEIPIKSYEMLTLIIKLVYEKAIGEPYLNDMYANLCYRLSQTVKKGGAFIQVIESDEDPSAEPGAEVDYSEGGSGSVSYRWSHDVSTSDAEIVGPFETDQKCIDVAIANNDENEPIKREDMELTLHRLLIQRGTFIKIMKSEDDKYYTVFFPMKQAEECGQQISLEIFTSEIEAQNHAVKMSTFKRSLLNKCEDEFNKQDIYDEWKKEKKEYEKKKSTLSEKKQKEIEQELEFRRMKLKKQMLGNIKFIGELYKLAMLKEKIMRFCIHNLLKIEEVDGGLRSKTGEDGEMDAEDHEALCHLFIAIGKNIDNPKAISYMTFYFNKIAKLSEDTTITQRSRFAYKDLIDMRANRWKLRRKVETAKTLEEIRKDAEREERQAQAQSAGYGGRGGGGRGRGGGRGYDNNNRRDGGRGSGGRGNYRDDNRGYDNRSSRDGGRGYGNSSRDAPSSRAPPVAPGMGAGGISPARGAGGGQVLSEEKLKIRANNMRQEFMQSKDKKELEMSIEEVLSSPNASKIIVATNVDYAADCKADELKTVIEMLDHLYRSGKVTKSDIESAMADLVEFIDSFACDNPRIYDYVGDMFCSFANMQALTVAWLADCTSKIMDESCKPKVIDGAMKSIQKEYGTEAVKSCFGDASERQALERLLGKAKLTELEAQFV